MAARPDKNTLGSPATGEKDSFAVSAPTISLPKGGGAIRGLGEKFTANPVAGTGSMSVPIATSPGRDGFGPKLSLDYDSGSGNGPFGFGWQLSLPSISRKTDKGLPRYQDAGDSDIFILSGSRISCRSTPANSEEGTTSVVTGHASRASSRSSSGGESHRRHRRILAHDFPRQRHDALRPIEPVACRTAGRPRPHLLLADLRELRRQGQRDPLRLQA